MAIFFECGKEIQTFLAETLFNIFLKFAMLAKKNYRKVVKFNT